MRLELLRNRFGLLVLFIVFGLVGFSSTEGISSVKSGASISGSTLSVQSSSYGVSTTDFVGGKLYAKLWYGDANRVSHANNWRVTVSYNLLPETDVQTLPSVSKTLVIDYKTTGVYTDIDYDELGLISGESYVKGVASGVTLTYEELVGSTWTTKPLPASLSDVHFELVLESEYYYEFDFSSPVLNSTPTYDATKNELNLSWGFVSGAEVYELEILSIDLGQGSSVGLKPTYEYDFRDAIRITTNQQHYELPMAFRESFMLFRVRAIQERQGVNEEYKRLEGNWSSPRKGSIASSTSWNYPQQSTVIPAYHWTDSSNLLKDKTWQYSVSYAEEGKSAQAIVFYDGIMSPRQQVTVSNTNEVAIVGEQVKDFIGRPAVSIMPAPIASKGIQYYENVNNASGGTAYDYKNFDVNSKYLTPDPLSATTSTGAANYYSGSRTLTGVNSDYIPDSDGYVYTRTKYTRDGTNRPVSQSGVGTTHKVGGKETKYYYGTTNRKELDRLFGNNVGFADNYKKNLVVDLNGQASVSYVDGSGRTVATALSGSSNNGGEENSNLDIDSKPESPVSITTDLSELNKIKGKKVLVNKEILIQQGQTITFNYAVTPDNFEDLCLTGDCYYDLSITIRNKETGALVSLTPSGGSPTTTITASQFKSKTLTFSGYLGIGTYQVTKVLSLNQAKLDEYYKVIIDGNDPEVSPQNCYPYTAPALLSGCDDNCISNCYSSYVKTNAQGDSSFYNNNGVLVGKKALVSGSYVETVFPPATGQQTYSEIRELLSDCRDNCTKKKEQTDCERRLSQLKEDMSPGGQYFDNLPKAGSAGYSKDGWLTSSANTFITLNSFNLDAGTSYSTWSQVRDNWKPEWENILVQGHPEYCALQSYCCVDEVPAENSGGIYTISADPLSLVLENGNITDDGCLEVPHNNQTNGFKDRVLHFKANYLTVNGNTYTLDNVANGNGGFTDPSCGSCASTLGTANQYIWDFYHHATTGLIGTGTGQMTVQAFIDQEMEKVKEKAKYHVASAHCSTFPLPSVSPVVNPEDNFKTAGGFDIRFLKMDWNAGVPTTADKIANCKTSCENMAQQWVDDFRCFSVLDESTHGDQTRFKQALIDICKGSCDLNQKPDDVTTPAITYYVKGVAYTATTFLQVVNQYRSSYGLTVGGCQTPKIPEDIHEENCGCDAVLDFAARQAGIDYWELPATYAAFLSSPYSIDLEAKLLTITGDANSSNFDKVYNHCIGDPILSHLSPSVHLPSELDCDQTELDSNGNPWTFTPTNPCEEAVKNINYTNSYNAKVAYRSMVEKKASEWIESYKEKCLTNGKTKETFTYSYTLNEYHYTLYYYDQAGNLVQTVSPEGVYQRNTGGVLFDETADLGTPAKYAQAKDHREGGTSTFVDPDYAMHTNYEYNSLNQLIKQTTPDGGTSYFFYDNLGRLQASQNAEQATSNKYSYTRYDALGRIIEVGELTSTTPLTDAISRSKTGSASTDWNAWFTAATPSRTQLVTTYYDDAPSFYGHTSTLENTRNRIVSVAYWDDNAQYTASTPVPSSASYYSYDINGNVHKLIQENKTLSAVHSNQKYKVLDYQYDLISGNVTQVDYQRTNPEERFSHKYDYDGDNRLTQSYTSRNGVIWEKESKNLYYLHGPLARIELGDKQVQAQDYAYTLQGWLKAVNSSMGHKDRDMGDDGKAGKANENFGVDAYGYSLHYFNGDYTTTGGGAKASMLASYSGSDFGNESPDLYNGNISKMIVGLTRQDQSRAHVVGNTYRYDQLNRIKNYTPFSVQDENTIAIFNDNSFTPGGSPVINNRYASSYSYDGNGNITSLNRNGSEVVLNDPGDPTSGYMHVPLEMDDFNYYYNKTGSTGLVKTDNKLYKVTDEPGHAPNYGNDLDGHTANENYVYDEIGRLKEDKLEKIDNIEWNVANKITKIEKDGGSHIIEFSYDPMGNRISKKDTKPAVTTTTFYVRDAQGNVMATYSHEVQSSISKDLLSLNDLHVYGSTRLGTRQESLALIDNGSPILGGLDQTYRKLGNKRYELSNHLGNVLEVISDRKLVGQSSGGNVNYYTADVVSYSDYYPFGMLMPNRHGSDASPNDQYKYGFQNQENDDEIAGKGNRVNYKYRMHDARIGRFFNPDPLEKIYSYNSPYAFSENRVIDAIELEGREKDLVRSTDFSQMKTKAKLSKTKAAEVEAATQKAETDALVEPWKYIFGYYNGVSDAEDILTTYQDAKESGANDMVTFQCVGAQQSRNARRDAAGGGSGNRGKGRTTKSTSKKTTSSSKPKPQTQNKSTTPTTSKPVTASKVAKSSEFHRTESLPKAAQSKVDGIAKTFTEQKGWGNVEAVKVFESNGHKYIIDGHHRYAAAKKAGIDIKYETVSADKLKNYNYSSTHEVISSATEVKRDKIK